MMHKRLLAILMVAMLVAIPSSARTTVKVGNANVNYYKNSKKKKS